MFSFAWRCSSLTHDLALSSDDCSPNHRLAIIIATHRTHQQTEQGKRGPYRLGDVIDHNSAVGISVVHGSQRLVSLLASRIPDLELDCRVLIQRDGLCQESSANRRLAVVIELILNTVNNETHHPAPAGHTISSSTITYFDESQNERTLDNKAIQVS